MPHSKKRPLIDGLFLQQKARLTEYLSQQTTDSLRWVVGAAPRKRKDIFAELGLRPGEAKSRFVLYQRPVLVFELLRSWDRSPIELFGAEIAAGLNLVFVCGLPLEELAVETAIRDQLKLQFLKRYLSEINLFQHRFWTIGLTADVTRVAALWDAICNKRQAWVVRSFSSPESARNALTQLSQSFPGITSKIPANPSGLKLYAIQQSKV